MLKCLQIMCAKYYELRYMFKKMHLVKVSAFAWYSVKIALFTVSDLKDEKLTKANVRENWNMWTLF